MWPWGVGVVGKVGDRKLQNTFEKDNAQHPPKELKVGEQDAYLSAGGSLAGGSSSSCLILLDWLQGSPFCSISGWPQQCCKLEGQGQGPVGQSEGTCMQGWGAGATWSPTPFTPGGKRGQPSRSSERGNRRPVPSWGGIS